jgi:uncharacterized protein YjaZ
LIENRNGFHIVDTESTYRRLLDEPEAAARTAIFQQQLVSPFAGLAQFFGGDGLATFAQWGMSPEAFTGAQRGAMAALIEALAAADAWERAAQALKTGWAAFSAHTDRIPLEQITFGLCLADLSAAPGAHGYTGFGGIPGWIMTVYGTADAYNLARVEAATVHELHHNLLGAHLGPGASMVSGTTGDYIVGEGLAEAFAAELYGADKVGPWVSQFDEADLERVKTLFRQGLDLTGFDRIRRYVFGDPAAGLPTFAGYAIGYRLVQAYLERSGQSVAEATFIPAQTIIAESQFFD